MAARVRPRQVGATHQSLHHLVAQADRDDAAVLRAVRAYALPALVRHGPVSACMGDDTAITKKGQHAIGVAHQFGGQLGKQAQCPVAVSLSAANDAASLLLAWRLHLPEEWAHDPERRPKAGVPDAVAFASKLERALGQVRPAVAGGVPLGTVVADPAYGGSLRLRRELTRLGLR